jgi:tetratricopeptide (TPR) repeat protein
MDARASANSAKPDRNDPCPCGSGRKYKQCCARREQAAMPTPGRERPSAADLRQAAIYLRQAAQLRDAGRIAHSLVPMQHAAKLSPNNSSIQHDLGWTYLNIGDFGQATTYLARAIALKPDFGHAHYMLGIALEELGRSEEAIAAYAKATALSRRLADAHVRRANVLRAIGHFDEAVEAYRAAATASPNNNEALVNEARALMLEDRNADAEPTLRRALVLDPKNNNAHWMLGTILAESGRYAEAAQEFERAIALNPQQSIAYYDLVHMRTLSDADRPLIARMLAVVPALRSKPQRAIMHMALGKAFDDLKDYGSAMRHLLEAASIRKAAIGSFDRALFGRYIDATIARFTRTFFAAHAGEGNTSDLLIAIVGMPRSGTTLVEQIVSSHSEVSGAGELAFWTHSGSAFKRFSDESAISEAISKIAEECLMQLRRAHSGAVRVTDKMPSNFLHAGLIHLVFPRATIIHCRRHPVDTCISVLSTNLKMRPGFPNEPDDLVFYYREYQRLMAHWRAVLPSERFVEVDYESLSANPEQESRRLIAACGLAWDPACLRPECNTRIVKTASRWQVRQPIYATSLDRWRGYEPWLGPLRELLT